MFNTSVIELSRDALVTNIKFIRSLLGPETILSSVVKGNAYGHGIEQYVPLAYDCGIRHFSVHSADEAIRVYESVDTAGVTVLIMGFVTGESMEWAINHQVEFFVFDFERLHEAIALARQTDLKARIHIELETGMNRTGFLPDELPELIRELKIHEAQLDLAGLCTHFAGAESVSNWLRIQEQKRCYEQGMADFKAAGLRPRQYHACCSAAMVRYPEMHFDMVRIGIMQYGFWPSREIFIEQFKASRTREDPLQRVITWKSQIMSIKEVALGEYIGYGTTYLAQKDMRIAIIPVGYSHGFSRSLSNQGRAIVNGVRVTVVGLVNMNNMMIDISDVPDAVVGGEVYLIGKQEDTEITVTAFGELSDQLNYELLTRLPYITPRIVKKEHGIY